METTTSQSESYRARWWIRVREPTLPFLWWGLLPLLGLLAAFGWGVTRFAHRTIEQTTEQRITADLHARGLSWVKVAADGQRVHLTGTVPLEAPATVAATALDHARGTLCPTWAGELTCATEVTAQFDVARPSPSVTTRWPSFVSTLEGGVLTVRGEASGEAMRAKLQAACEGLKAPPRITSVTCDISLAAAPAPEGYGALAERVLSVIAQCESGTSQAREGVFSASCDVTRAAFGGADAAARAAFPAGGTVGQVQLLVKEDIDACEKDFAALLDRSRIEFAVSSAVIVPAAKPLLDQLAVLAKKCPGGVRIEGHTDSVGSLEANTALSQARAESVRVALVSRGVEAARLRTQGFGPTKPLQPNDTPAGRAKNRRIEFHIERLTGETP